MPPAAPEPLAPSDVPAAAAVLARAFADNPCYVHLHAHARDRDHALRGFFTRDLRWHAPSARTWVLRDGDACVATATLVPPPGHVAAGPVSTVGHWVVPTLRDAGPRTLLRMAHVDATIARRYRAAAGGVDHWTLHAVAVDPAVQGGGWGTTVVRTALGAVADDRPVVLTTQLERNLPFYARLGFTVTGSVRIGRRPGFRTWFMRRRRAAPLAPSSPGA